MRVRGRASGSPFSGQPMMTAALTFWLTTFELLADLLGWRGLQWGAAPCRSLVLVALLRTTRRLGHRGPVGGALLVLTFPVALVLHLALASLRNWQLNPRHRLRPGAYADRTISACAISTPSGPIPALHIVPRGGASAAVCYVHGSGSDKYFYTWNVTDALIAQRLAVLIIDLDGHGSSPRPQAFPAMLHSVTGALTWLHRHYTRVGVIGTSLGGCLAARAVADGAPAAALVILAAPPQLHLSRYHVQCEALRLLKPTVLRQLRASSPYHLIRAWTRTPPIRARIGTVPLIAALDLLGSLARIRIPLLAIYARHDAIVSPRQAAQVQHALPPTATCHLVPAASHLSLIIDPQVLQQISTWLHARLQ